MVSLRFYTKRAIHGIVVFLCSLQWALGGYPADMGESHDQGSLWDTIYQQGSQLQDDFALALLASGYPHVMGLNHLSTPLSFEELSNKVLRLKLLNKKLMESSSLIQHEIMSLAVYYDFLGKLIYLSHLQKRRVSLDLESYYITIDAETVQEWGGKKAIRELNSKEMSIYDFFEHQDSGHTVKFKERFLVALRLKNNPHENQNDQLLELGKMLATKVLIKNLAMTTFFVGEEGSHEDSYHQLIPFPKSDSHQNLLREEIQNIKHKHSLGGAVVENQEVQKIILSWPLINLDLVVDILETIFPGESFFKESEGTREFMELINANHPLIFTYMRDHIISLERNDKDDLVSTFVDVIEQSRKKLLLDLILETLKNSANDLNEAMIDRLDSLIKGQHGDTEWRQRIRLQLKDSSYWHEMMKWQKGPELLSRDIIRSVRKIRGDLRVVESYQEQMKMLTQLALKQLGEHSLTTTVFLIAQGLEKSTGLEKAQKDFWKSYQKRLKDLGQKIEFKDYIDRESHLFNLEGLADRIQISQVKYTHAQHTDEQKKIHHQIYESRKKDIQTLLHLARNLGFDKGKEMVLAEQLAWYQKQAPQMFRDLFLFEEISSFPILNVAVEEMKGKKKTFREWIGHFLSHNTLRQWIESRLDEGKETEDIMGDIRPVLAQAIGKIQENIYQGLESVEKAKHLKDLEALLVNSVQMQKMLRPYALQSHTQFIQESQALRPFGVAWEALVSRYMHSGFSFLIILQVGSFLLKFNKSLGVMSTFLRNAYHAIPSRYLSAFNLSAMSIFFADGVRGGKRFYHQKDISTGTDRFFHSSIQGENGLFQYEDILKENSKLFMERIGFYSSLVVTPLFLFPILMASKTIQNKLALFMQKQTMKGLRRIEKNFTVLGFEKGRHDWNPEVIKTVSLEHQKAVFSKMQEIYWSVTSSMGKITHAVQPTSSLLKATKEALAQSKDQIKHLITFSQRIDRWSLLSTQRHSLRSAEEKLKGLLKNAQISEIEGEGILKQIFNYHGYSEKLFQISRAERDLFKILNKERRKWENLAHYYRSDFETLGVEGGDWWKGGLVWENYKKAKQAFSDGLLSYREFSPIKAAMNRLERVYRKNLIQGRVSPELAKHAWMMTHVRQASPHGVIPRDWGQSIKTNIFGKELHFESIKIKSEGQQDYELIVPHWAFVPNQ